MARITALTERMTAALDRSLSSSTSSQFQGVTPVGLPLPSQNDCNLRPLTCLEHPDCRRMHPVPLKRIQPYGSLHRTLKAFIEKWVNVMLKSEGTHHVSSGENQSVQFLELLLETILDSYKRLVLNRKDIVNALHYRAIYDAAEAAQTENPQQDQDQQPVCVEKISERVDKEINRWKEYWLLTKSHKDRAAGIAVGDEAVYGSDCDTLFSD
jgi:hypothetical protein